MSSTLLAVRNVSVTYGDDRVLTDANLDVGEGELVAVIGPNGAGKSTLFKAITGLVPHTGEVEVGGEVCHHRRDRMSVASVPQRSEVDPEFPVTVGQLVASGRRRFRGVGQRLRAVDKRAAAEALARVGLEGLERRPIGAVSGGQAQRAFLARALAQEARVVLLDEVLSGVDSVASEELLDVFSELTASGVSIVVATHDLALARRRFARCIALNRRIVADGAPSEVLGTDVLDRVFGSAGLTAGV